MINFLRVCFPTLAVAGIVAVIIIYTYETNINFSSTVDVTMRFINGNSWSSSANINYDARNQFINQQNHSEILHQHGDELFLLAECPQSPPTIVGYQKPNITEKKEEDLEKMFFFLKPGGRYSPEECQPEQKTAILIPYRDRRNHLNILLLNLVPFLVRQQLSFTIFIIELNHNITFNRALLLNAGFLEAMKIDNFTCFVFHDVDLIPLDDRNLYRCGSQPRQLAVALNKWGYNHSYNGYFGGVSALSRDHILTLNGCSNLYFGWGGEDDDLMKRISFKGMQAVMYGPDIARYDMIQHNIDKGNEVNPIRYELLETATSRIDVDGLNTAKYTINALEFRPLYTWIKLSFNMTEIIMNAPPYEQSLFNNTYITWKYLFGWFAFWLVVFLFIYFTVSLFQKRLKTLAETQNV